MKVSFVRDIKQYFCKHDNVVITTHGEKDFLKVVNTCTKCGKQWDGWLPLIKGKIQKIRGPSESE